MRHWTEALGRGPLSRRDLLNLAGRGLMAYGCLPLLGACGDGPTTPGGGGNDRTRPATADVKRIASGSAAAAFVTEPLPTGFGTGPGFDGSSLQAVAGSTVSLPVFTDGPVDELLIAIPGRTGHFRLDLRGVTPDLVAGREPGTGGAGRMRVLYNLEVDVAPDARPGFELGVVSMINTFLSLMSGITICFGACTPPPPPPIVHGVWGYRQILNGQEQIEIPFVIRNYTLQPDATARFQLIPPDESYTGLGLVTSNRQWKVALLADPTGFCYYLGTFGSYVDSSDTNGGRPEARGTLALLDACRNGNAGLFDFGEPFEGSAGLWRQISP